MTCPGLDMSISSIWYSLPASPVAAHAVAKTRFLHRIRKRTPATGHQTHHRAEYPDIGLLRQAEFRRSGSTSRTGAGMAVDPRQRQRRLRTFRRQLLQGRRRSRTQDRRPQHGGDPQHFRSDRGYAFFRKHRNVLG